MKPLILLCSFGHGEYRAASLDEPCPVYVNQSNPEIANIEFSEYKNEEMFRINSATTVSADILD